MATDEELKATINSSKSKKQKYERVKNSISSHRLNYTRSVKEMDDFITYCEGIISTVNSEPGYHYLENFATKLQKDVDTMTEYRDFVQDANTSFKNLYTVLEAKIKSLETDISNAMDEYNEGKQFWEKIY